MPQKFIDNFDVVTAFPLAADAFEQAITDLLDGEPLARIQALLASPGDWVTLTLLAEGGEYETIRVDSELQRDYSDSGFGPLAWPAGSRVVAAYTATAATAAKAATRPLIASSEDTLVLSALGAWLWGPTGVNPIALDISQMGEVAGDFVLLLAEVLLASPDSGAPLVVTFPSAPLFVKLPAGAAGVYDAEAGEYVLTLAPAERYRLRLGGPSSAITLDVSDYSDYTAIY